MVGTREPGQALLDRLAAAASGHDLDGIVDCFTSDYRNETPAHPAQGFTGRDQVRRNWEQILAFVPDLTARVLRSCCQGDVVWSEWEMTGTRRDGAAHKSAGVMIFGVRDGRFGWVRFYLEPVQAGGPDADQAIRQQVGTGAGVEAGPGPR